jgi:hypothetical protein
MSQVMRWLHKLDNWLAGLERIRNEAWLARSTNVFQLEARLRELQQHAM